MSLGKKQRAFAEAVGLLLVFAYANGYELTFGDAYRDPRVFGKVGEHKGYGHAHSVHKSRLAIDLNLFVGGDYITDGDHPAWKVLHNKWKELGGAEMIAMDANHFSFGHGGVI